MELKTYQKNVIGDLSRFLTLLTETGSASKAYSALWTEKDVNVGLGGLPYYRSGCVLQSAYRRRKDIYRSQLNQNDL